MSEENEDKKTEPTEEENDAALLAAVSAGVDEATPQSVKDAQKPDGEKPDGEKPDGEKPDGEKPDGEKPDGEKPDGEKPDGEKPSDIEAQLAAAKAADSEKPDGEKPDGEKPDGEKPDGEKPDGDVDPINDPIPESTNEKTAARIKSLIEMARDNTAGTAERDEIMEQINSTGTDPEQYANTLGFLRLYNSTDPTQRKQALEAARGVVRELSIELGEGSADLLAEHDDLRAEIEAGTLTEDRAIEIATSRAKTALDGARATAAQGKKDTDAQTAANVKIGKTQLNEAEAELNAADKDYAALRPTFIAMLRPVLRNTHPTEYGATARQLYAELKKTVKLPEEKPTPKPPANTPLRPKQGAGGGDDMKGEPKSAIAAMDEALENL